MIWVLTVAGAAWLALMMLAVVIPIAPRLFLGLVAPFVCSRGSRLEVTRVKLSYHRPGEHGLVVRRVGAEGTRSVRGRAISALGGLFFLVSLLPVWLVVRLLPLH